MADEEARKILANNLQYYLDKKGIDRNELCKALNLKYSTVSEWFQGNKYPRIDKIEMLAKFFGIKKSDLIEKRSESDDNIEQNNNVSDDDIMFALFNGSEGITDEMFDEVKQFAEMVKMREKFKKKGNDE